MSAGAVKWARKQRTDGPVDKAILLILAAESGTDFTATLPIPKLADESDASCRAVSDGLKRLRKRGLVSWEPCYREEGNTYRLHS